MKFVDLGHHSWACISGGDDVFHSYGANQGFIANGDACIVVDSGFQNKTAQQILTRVRKLRPKRLLFVDTHYHSDHVFGNTVFAAMGATVLSHEKCRRTMRAKSARLLAKYRARDPRLARILENVRVSYPSLTYWDRLRAYPSEDLAIEMFHPGGRAHTDGDSIVHVPDDRVVFAGDVLWVGYHPNLEDSDIQGQIRALQMILRLRPRRVVPGHGPVCGLKEVQRFIRYLEELDRSSRGALKAGLGPEEMVRRAVPSWSEGWKMRRLVGSYLHGLVDRQER